jgi:hypothetical protein
MRDKEKVQHPQITKHPYQNMFYSIKEENSLNDQGRFSSKNFVK